MAMTWDLNDVPAVSSDDLAAVMRALVDDERGLVLLRGLEDGDLDTVNGELQNRFHGDPQSALAIFVRFRNLVDVFSARRLKDMVLNSGYAILAPAIAIAASQRLNAQRGFNPQRFILALNEALEANVVALEPRRAAPAQEAVQLQAA